MPFLDSVIKPSTLLPYFQTQLTPPRGEIGGSLEPLNCIKFGKIFLGAPPPDPRLFLNFIYYHLSKQLRKVFQKKKMKIFGTTYEKPKTLSENEQF